MFFYFPAVEETGTSTVTCYTAPSAPLKLSEEMKRVAGTPHYGMKATKQVAGTPHSGTMNHCVWICIMLIFTAVVAAAVNVRIDTVLASCHGAVANKLAGKTQSGGQLSNRRGQPKKKGRHVFRGRRSGISRIAGRTKCTWARNLCSDGDIESNPGPKKGDRKAQREAAKAKKSWRPVDNEARARQAALIERMNGHTQLHIQTNTSDAETCLEKALLTSISHGNALKVEPLGKQVYQMCEMTSGMCKQRMRINANNGPGHYVEDAQTIVETLNKASPAHEGQAGLNMCLLSLKVVADQGDTLVLGLKTHVMPPVKAVAYARCIVLDPKGFLAGRGTGHYYCARVRPATITGWRFTIEAPHQGCGDPPVPNEKVDELMELFSGCDTVDSTKQPVASAPAVIKPVKQAAAAPVVSPPQVLSQKELAQMTGAPHVKQPKVEKVAVVLTPQTNKAVAVPPKPVIPPPLMLPVVPRFKPNVQHLMPEPIQRGTLACVFLNPLPYRIAQWWSSKPDPKRPGDKIWVKPDPVGGLPFCELAPWKWKHVQLDKSHWYHKEPGPLVDRSYKAVADVRTYSFVAYTKAMFVCASSKENGRIRSLVPKCTKSLLQICALFQRIKAVDPMIMRERIHRNFEPYHCLKRCRTITVGEHISDVVASCGRVVQDLSVAVEWYVDYVQEMMCATRYARSISTWLPHTRRALSTEVDNFTLQVGAGRLAAKFLSHETIKAMQLLELYEPFSDNLATLVLRESPSADDRGLLFELFERMYPTVAIGPNPLCFSAGASRCHDRPNFAVTFDGPAFDCATLVRSYFRPKSDWLFWVRQEHPYTTTDCSEYMSHYAGNREDGSPFDMTLRQQWWVEVAELSRLQLHVFGQPTVEEMRLAAVDRLCTVSCPLARLGPESMILDDHHFQVGPKYNRITIQMGYERELALGKRVWYLKPIPIDSEFVITQVPMGRCWYTRLADGDKEIRVNVTKLVVPKNVSASAVDVSCHRALDHIAAKLVDKALHATRTKVVIGARFQQVGRAARLDATEVMPSEMADVSASVYAMATLRNFRDQETIRGVLSRQVATKYKLSHGTATGDAVDVPKFSREQVDEYVRVVADQDATLLHGAGGPDFMQITDVGRTPLSGVKACYFCAHPFSRGERHRNRTCGRCCAILNKINAPCFVTEAGLAATLGYPSSFSNVGPVVYRAMDLPIPEVKTYDLDKIFFGKYAQVLRRIMSPESVTFHKSSALYGFGTRFPQNAAPRGDRSILQAVIVRVARKTDVEPEPAVFLWALQYYKSVFDNNPEETCPDDRDPVPTDEWLQEVSNRRVMETAVAQLEVEGLEPLVWKLFTKAEKSAGYDKTRDDEICELRTFKPRAIQAMPITWQAKLGPFVKAVQRKVARVFNSKTPVFYAGKANPKEMNEWANRFVTCCGNYWFIMIDYSMFDNTHSDCSFDFVEAVYAHLVDLPDDVRECFRKMRIPKGRAAGFKYKAPKTMNGSGRPDTSLANIVNSIAALINLCCFLVSGRSADTLTHDQVGFYLQAVMIAANGDDSLLRIAKVDCVVDRAEMPKVIEEQIARFGFVATEDKQLITDDPAQIVFLGNTVYPVGGTWYWGPTLGRRLPKHHVFHEHHGDGMAWLNGVAKMESLVYPHVPVLHDMAVVVTKQLSGCKLRTVEKEVRERRYKCQFEMADVPPYDDTTVSFVEKRYGLAAGELRSLIHATRACVVPCILHHPVLDRMVAHDEN